MAQDSISDEWKDLKELGIRFKSFSGLMTVLVTLLPLGGLAWTTLIPPYKQAAAFAVAAALLWNGFAFLVFRSATPESMARFAKYAFVVGGMLAIIYAILSVVVVFETTDQRIVTGFGLSPYGENLVDTGKVQFNHPRDLLARVGYEHASVVYRGHAFAEAILVFTFCGACTLFSSAFFLQVMRHIALDRLPETAVARPTASATTPP